MNWIMKTVLLVSVHALGFSQLPALEAPENTAFFEDNHTSWLIQPQEGFVGINQMSLPVHLLNHDISFKASPNLVISIPIAAETHPKVKIVLYGPFQTQGWIMGLAMDNQYDPLVLVKNGLGKKAQLEPLKLSDFMARLRVFDTLLGFHALVFEVLDAPREDAMIGLNITSQYPDMPLEISLLVFDAE